MNIYREFRYGKMYPLRAIVGYKKLILLLVIFCAQQLALAMNGSGSGETLIVEPEWLKNNLSEAELVVIDARDSSQYISGHIKGAVNIPVTSTFSGPPRDDLVGPISLIQKIFSEAGIDNNSHVIIYDNGEYVDAARLFWVLEVFGHHYVRILNGGMQEWIVKQYPVSDKVVVPVAKTFIPTVVPERLSTKLSTRLAIDNNKQILIDARSAEEYSGQKSITERYGHIPSAINIPSINNYAAQGKIRKIKPIAELSEIYRKLDKSKKIIAYCNKGKESALTYFILRELGYHVSTYDGSWFEWSMDDTLPVNTPGPGN